MTSVIHTPGSPLKRASGLAACALAVLGLAAGPTYAAAGDLDLTFGDDGQSSLSVNPHSADPRDIAVDNSGRILLAGYVIDPEDNEGQAFAVARLLPSGIPDAAFGDTGVLVTPVGGR